MKIRDKETDTIHDAVSIDFKNEIVVMKSAQYGYTSQMLDLVEFMIEPSDPNTIILPK